MEFKGWYFHEDYLYFAMEYCPWGDIDICYPHPVLEIEARSICGQLLEALQVLHKAGIVHRDIKPKVSSELCLYSISDRR